MDWTQFAGLVLAALVTSAVPILLPRVLTLISANIHDKDVALIAEAAARAAGRIALQIATAKQAQPSIAIAPLVASALAAERETVMGMVADTIAKIGVPAVNVEKMIAGELGKLLSKTAAADTLVLDPGRGGMAGFGA